MKQTKSEFIDPILDTLAASLLGNVLEGKGVVQAVEGTIRPRFAMEPHPLTNFEIQNIIKLNLNLELFIQELIYLK